MVRSRNLAYSLISGLSLTRKKVRNSATDRFRNYTTLAATTTTKEEEEEEDKLDDIMMSTSSLTALQQTNKPSLSHGSSALVRRSISSTAAEPRVVGSVMRCCCKGVPSSCGSDEVISAAESFVSSSSSKSTMLIARQQPTNVRPSLLLKRYKSHIFGGGGNEDSAGRYANSSVASSSDEFFVSSGNYRASCPNIYENRNNFQEMTRTFSSSCDALTLNHHRLFDYPSMNEYITDENEYRVVRDRRLKREPSYMDSSDFSDLSQLDRRSDLQHLDDRSRLDLYRRRSCGGGSAGLDRWFRPLSHFPSMASTTLSYCKGYTSPRLGWWKGSSLSGDGCRTTMSGGGGGGGVGRIARRISTVHCLLSISTRQITTPPGINNKFSVSETDVY